MASVEIVLPVYNEERVLADSVSKLHPYMSSNVFHEWRIVIADNGSTDATFDIGTRLSKELSASRVPPNPEAGRGRALSLAWLASDADVLAYMDIDLSTDLGRLPAACEPRGRPGLRRRRPVRGWARTPRRNAR